MLPPGVIRHPRVDLVVCPIILVISAPSAFIARFPLILFAFYHTGVEQLFLLLPECSIRHDLDALKTCAARPVKWETDTPCRGLA